MVAVVVLVTGAFSIVGCSSLMELGWLMQKILLAPGEMGLAALLQRLFSLFSHAVLQVLVASFLPGAVITLLQIRFRLATEEIEIYFSHLNPVSGFKKIFSIRSLKELAKAFLYLLVFHLCISLFCYLACRYLYTISCHLECDDRTVG